ncbi:Translation initiation factor [Lasiodiplodia theobromae]|uniref:Eukaryotic translation initiation factor 4E type 3-B n=2 Tax=Lasiodiplodia theobromae TaxID=45133 RepID=A0A5N5DSX2_9PEZI|nr:Translation initiation factor [Lasiodiplodia theobromae]KAB2581075.1 Eukaryotic translation initiation factor 4E type 3-B [Lasiodiplodia theobromae]KAF4539868.1 Translation initiation factor [Lasiodiplodia theobromae]
MMASTAVSSADKPALPVYSRIPGARCIEIIHDIHDLSDLRAHPPSTLEDPKQFDHLQSLVHAFAAFKAELLAEFDEPLKSIATQPAVTIAAHTEPESETMSARPTVPGLATNGLPVQGEGDASATASPARGKAMKEALLQKLRPPPLEHSWEFWHDRQGRESKPAWAQEEEQKLQQQNGSDPDSPTDKVNESNEYESRLVKLHVIRDLRQFWETMNHFELSTLRLRDSVHLFHLGVKPVWEDPRNLKGGAWTFRVPKEKAPQFWKEVSMMAVGGELQSAVDNSAKRNAFIDDICGISYSVRFNSHLISIWNRDAGNQEGIDRLRDVVLGGISPDLQIRENQYYYKRHSEHAGFRFPNAEQKE